MQALRSGEMTASQRAAALGRIAALESEVSSLRMRAEEEKDQVAVLRAKLDRAEELLEPRWPSSGNRDLRSHR